MGSVYTTPFAISLTAINAEIQVNRNANSDLILLAWYESKLIKDTRILLRTFDTTADNVPFFSAMLSKIFCSSFNCFSISVSLTAVVKIKTFSFQL